MKLKQHALFAAVCGNFIEWYDFALYLLLAPILAQHFFPPTAQHLALLGTLTVYAVSFFFRPLGGIFFGYLGDRYGRRLALRWSITGLTSLSIVLACLPDYNQIGPFATLSLCLCRIAQGLCLGGEFAGSMIYLSESASPHRRSFFSALSNNGSNFGIMIASLSTIGLNALLGETAVSAWGYRLLFLFGGLIGVIGFGYRTNLKESSEFLTHSLRVNNPLKTVLTYHRPALWRLFCVVNVGAVGSYALMGYVSTFLQQELNYSLNEAVRYETLFISISLILVPAFALLADYLGAKRLLVYCCLLYIIIAIPVFYAFYVYQQPLFLMLLFCVYSIEEACVPVLMREYFPIHLRYTAASLSYNLSMGFVGGLSPVIGHFLLANLHLPYGIAYLLIGASVFGLWGLRFLSFSIPVLDYPSKTI
ncbi:proline/betaine transport protein homolog [Legionella steigerwaltii]|uniref:Proline/betaine transport protein homolog n=1 Tax=Legionella steigerwaltii TaxID=460 RepID=A0A378LCP4_9GAMM|nr:MFS transporter [Legionella steigerwaltii]KTD77817.1 hypothetical protein Lstg_1540 [Legionella steigerwaltii]STY24457.1 proline/betaine transport protein homolog [Legionella steigerwaltii]